MVFKRGLAELTKEERKSKFCKALIEGRIISNYVFSRTKYICGGCGEVITTSGAISSHMQQCAAIAEIESGDSVENSLLAASDGFSYVKPIVVLFKRDPWADTVMKQGGREGDKETKDTEEEGKKEGNEDRLRAGSTGALSGSDVALAGLLSLNASKCRKAFDGVANTGNSHAEAEM